MVSRVGRKEASLRVDETFVGSEVADVASEGEERGKKKARFSTSEGRDERETQKCTSDTVRKGNVATRDRNGLALSERSNGTVEDVARAVAVKAVEEFEDGRRGRREGGVGDDVIVELDGSGRDG